MTAEHWCTQDPHCEGLEQAQDFPRSGQIWTPHCWIIIVESCVALFFEFLTRWPLTVVLTREEERPNGSVRRLFMSRVCRVPYTICGY